MPKITFTRAAGRIRDHAAAGMRRFYLFAGRITSLLAVGMCSCTVKAILIAAAGLLACAYPYCSAQTTTATPRYTVDHFGTSKEGLPSSVVLALIQTRDGYLWLGTQNGLARFDGVDFTVFDENNTPGLKTSVIVSLFEDSRTNLWVGTEGLQVALVKEGKLTTLEIGQLKAASEDTNGAVWLYTADGQLCRYRDKKVDVWHAGPGRPSLNRNLITDDAGLLWIGTDRNLVALGPLPATASVGLPVAQEVQLSRLDLLLASKHGGYWRLADGRVQKWKGQKLEFNWAYPWTNIAPVAACEDLDGNLVVGTYGDGVYWFNASGKATRLGSEQGLSHNSVLALTIDREGSLWVGTNGGGLNRVRRQIFGLIEGSQGFTVQSVSEDAQSELWIGYNNVRIDHWKQGVVEHFNIIPDPNFESYVKSVFVDSEQRVLAGTQNEQGPHLFQFISGGFLALDSPVTRDVSAIHLDQKGALWIGTRGGLFRRDKQGWKALTVNEGLSANDVRAIADDSQGNLWIGTAGGGLNRLYNGKFTTFTKTNGLASENISSLYVDDQQILWVATSGGLARYSGGKWTAYSKQHGLISNSLSYLLEDGQGYLWLGSKAGLIRVRKQDLNDFAQGKASFIPSRAYGELDGLPASECTSGSQPSAIRTRSGTLLFPTIKGLVSLVPSQLKLNTNPPPIIIESVSIDNQLQTTNLLRGAAPSLVTIPARKEVLDIKYTSLNLAAPDKGRFRYRLKGYETEWREAPWNLRIAHYTRLPPGEYGFNVTACNEDGTWNPAGSTLKVKVLPPFWSTWWFRTISALCLLGLIIGSVHYVSTQRLQRQLESLRQQELLEKERARIARDLHDQLGANLTQVALLGELAESDKESPAEVELHARQISQTARETTHALDEIVWTVNPSNDTLDGLINYVCKYAQEFFALAALRYRLEVPSPLPNTPITPEMRHNVFLAAKEAVNNVIKHSHATSAWLRLHLRPDGFTLEIEDNGRGLNPDDYNKGRSGLRNMRKRVEDVGGQFEAGPGAEGGTRVQLKVKLHSERNQT